MIDSDRFRERHALTTRLWRMSNETTGKVGGFTSWGEVITAESKVMTPMIDGPLFLQPSRADPEHAPKQLGFGHMDKIAREMKQP